MSNIDGKPVKEADLEPHMTGDGLLLQCCKTGHVVLEWFTARLTCLTRPVTMQCLYEVWVESIQAHSTGYVAPYKKVFSARTTYLWFPPGIPVSSAIKI
jgi:hypothetical protein